jgi:glycosyltransferase involved in cell wall biosynthesis
MKLLINTSNINRGGAIQVAHSFLNEIKNNTIYTFHVVLSEALADQVELNSFPSNFVFYNYTKKLNIFKAVIGKDSFLSRLEKMIIPSCVFTIFGPAYWTPFSNHVVGFAYGWCYNPESVAFKEIKYLARLKLYWLIKFKSFRINKESDVLIVETNDARKRISSLNIFPIIDIEVVGNTYNEIYNLGVSKKLKLKPKVHNEFRLLTISANYQHKNLKIIKKVIPYLDAKCLMVRFIITIDNASYKKVFKGFEDTVINLGPIDVEFGPSVYDQCDALFLPTLLETFSASYPEAMKIEKPILTSDLSFAKDICGDAAEYFDPLDPEDIANKIEIIIGNSNRRADLIKLGKERLKSFETAKSRSQKYLKICNKLTNLNGSSYM